MPGYQTESGSDSLHPCNRKKFTGQELNPICLLRVLGSVGTGYLFITRQNLLISNTDVKTELVSKYRL